MKVSLCLINLAIHTTISDETAHQFMNKKQLLLLEKQFDKCITELNTLIKMQGFSEFDERTTDGVIKLGDKLSEEIILLREYKFHLKEPIAKDFFPSL